MSENVVESAQSKIKKLKTFTVEEVLIIGSFMMVAITVLSYYTADFIFRFNNYLAFDTFSNQYNWATFIPSNIYLWIVVSTCLVLFVTINFYLIFELLFFKATKNVFPYSVRQFSVRAISINIVIFFLYFIGATVTGYEGFGTYANRDYYGMTEWFVNYSNFENHGFYFSTVSIILILFTIGYFVFKYSKLESKNFNYEEKTFWKLLKSNFVIFYPLNFVLVLFLYYQANNIKYEYINEIFIVIIGLNMPLFSSNCFLM